MPHPLRTLAAGLEVECLPLGLFIDDMSGNTSKQWSVHYSAYYSNLSLPRTLLDKQENVHFITTSATVSPMELLIGVVKCLK